MAIVNVNHRTECIEKGVEHIDLDGLKAFQKDKKAIMRWARKFDLIIVSSNINKKVIKLAGKALGSVARLPIQVAENDSVVRKITELKRSVRFRTKKVAWMGSAVGIETLNEEQIRQNVVKSINFLVSLLPKGWLNIKSINLKTTMGKPSSLY